MKIYLLRHAQAEPSYPDASRNLTEAGVRHVACLAAFLKESNALEVGLIWHSPYARAEQTAAILVDRLELDDVPLQVREDLTPESEPQGLLREMAELTSNVLIVGHNPHLSVLAALLLAGERGRVRIDLQTCNLLCLEWFPFPNYGETGPCSLSWMLDPRILK